MSRPRRILVIRPDRIGDVVLATPLIRALRSTFADAYLGALVRPAVAPVLQGNPHLDVLLTDDVEGADAGRAGFQRKRRELRRHRFDTALMLLPTERHAWMAFLAGIPRRYGVGWKLYQVITFTRGISRHKYVPLRHEADYCLDLGRAIGVRSDDLRTEVFLEPTERAHARDTLSALGRDVARSLVSLHPESGRSAPNWDLRGWLTFTATLLSERPDIQVMVSLPPGSTETRGAFTRTFGSRVLLPDTEGDLRLLMALIAEAAVAVSASTGPMHLAAALGVSTVSLFCPLTPCSPLLWGPQGNRSAILLPPDDFCRTRCPGDPHICTLEGGVSAPQVIAAIDAFTAR
jgi:heptosyltransferase II